MAILASLVNSNTSISCTQLQRGEVREQTVLGGGLSKNGYAEAAKGGSMRSVVMVGVVAAAAVMSAG